jgi:hypothetical protein
VHELEEKGASLQLLKPAIDTGGTIGRMVTVLGMVAEMERGFIRGRQRAEKAKGVSQGPPGDVCLQTLPFVDSSLTISARRRKHLAQQYGWWGKQPRIAPMKIALITAASAIFICGTALAREVIVSPIVPFHGASSLTEHRTAQIESAAREGVVLCTTRYVTTTHGDGNSTTRKSVNCEE